LIQLRLTGQVVTLRGNHELMLLAALEEEAAGRSWLHFGGREALESYDLPERRATLNDIPTKHLHFIRQNCVDWYETETHLFVHANIQHDWPMEAQLSRMLHWEFLDPRLFKPHISGKTMICGHSEQRNGSPLVIPGAICIDTWAYGDGWLTCLDVGSGHYFQANDFGESRDGYL
jgi:serine/threonine protein phosphatase 1